MVLLTILGISTAVSILSFILWYLLFTDCDTNLAFAKKFGYPVERFRGKVLWITGASSGLGEAMAHELASVGAKLILSSRRKDLLEKVKEECLDRSGGKLEKKDILVLPFDICNTEMHQTNVENAINHFGKIDVLINNAARYQVGSIKQTQPEVIKDLFDINFFGGMNLTRLLLNHFLDNGKGHIVVVSSIAGKLGIPSAAFYAATKHALQGFYETLRMEYNRDNIAVTMVYPGIFKSEMYSQTMSSTKGQLIENDTDEYGCNKMTSAECAHLTLLAAANKLFESWVAYQPFLLMLWGSQYAPNAFKYLMMSKIYTKSRISSLVDGIWPNDLPVWKPLVRCS